MADNHINGQDAEGCYGKQQAKASIFLVVRKIEPDQQNAGNKNLQQTDRDQLIAS